jgi:glutamate racemase
VPPKKIRIGVFDSGVGGLTVLHALQKKLPSAQFYYYGDTANLPYGTKSPEQIKLLSVAAVKALQRFVFKKSHTHLDLLVIACNTASAHAIDEICTTVNPSTLVLGVVEPGARVLVNSVSTKGGPIAVMATRATVRSGAYRRAVRRFEKESKSLVGSLTEIACPLLVPIIEEGWAQTQVAAQVVAEYVQPLLKMKKRGSVLLGCTHYPWLIKEIRKQLPGWTVINSADAVAALAVMVLPATRNTAESSRGKVSIRSHSPKKRSLAFRLLKVSYLFSDPHGLPTFLRGRSF